MIELIRLAPGNPNYTQRVILDGVEYVMNLLWSQRETAWYLDILSADGTPLLMGVRVVSNYPLLASARAPGVPAGELVAVDTRRNPKDPALDELGDTIVLCYGSVDELAAAPTVLSSSGDPPPTPGD